MAHRHLLLTLTVLVLLAACSSSSPQPVAPAAATPASQTPVAAAGPAAVDTSGMATVCIYRPKAFVGMALRPTVMVGGNNLVNIGNGRVYIGHFAPGKYLFQMDDKKSGAEIDVKPGDRYFFRVEIVPGFWKGGGRMTLMDPKQGEYEITQLQPVPVTEIEDKSHQ